MIIIKKKECVANFRRPNGLHDMTFGNNNFHVKKFLKNNNKKDNENLSRSEYSLFYFTHFSMTIVQLLTVAS